jgi:hypothetical protein
MSKIKSRTLAIFVIGLLFARLAMSQESTNSLGGDAAGNGGSVSFSIGQVVYFSNSANNGTVSQGIQYAFEIFTLSTSEMEQNISLKIYPNPTTWQLTMEMAELKNNDISYELINIQGIQVDNGLLGSQYTYINFSNLPSATYVLNVLNQENKKLQSFKIIKN